MSEKEKILKPAIEKSPDNKIVKPEIPTESGLSKDRQASSETSGDFLPSAKAASASMTPPATPEVERQVEIERILEEDLATVYFNLPEDKKEKFRLQGEQTAWQINKLLASTKIKVQKIITLIKNWLLLIPGVNRFFLEQEAKLKADEIIKLKDKF